MSDNPDIGSARHLPVLDEEGWLLDRVQQNIDANRDTRKKNGTDYRKIYRNKPGARAPHSWSRATDREQDAELERRLMLGARPADIGRTERGALARMRCDKSVSDHQMGDVLTWGSSDHLRIHYRALERL